MHSARGVLMPRRILLAVMRGLIAVTAAASWSATLGAQVASVRARAGDVPMVDRQFTASEGLPTARVRSLIANSPTDVWVLEGSGLVRYDGFLFHSVGARDGLPPGGQLDLIKVPGESGGFVVVYGSALYRRTATGFAALPLPDSMVFRVSRPAIIGPDSVVVTHGSRVFLVSGAAVTDVHQRLGLGATQVSRVWSTRRGSLWLLSDRGLLHWEAGRLETRLAWTGVGMGINQLVEREDGALGYFNVTHPRDVRGLWNWRRGEAPQRLTQELVEEVGDIALSGETVAVTHMYGAASVRRGRGRFEEVRGHDVGRFSAVDFGPDGTLWLGAERGVIARERAPRPIWSHQRLEGSRLGNRIHEMLRTQDGTLWIASADGLWRLRPDGTESWIREAVGVRLTTITGLAESPAGTLWVSSGGDFPGVLRFDGRTWAHELSGGTLRAVYGHRLRTDRSGALWLLGLGPSAPYGTGPSLPGGAFRLEAGEFRPFRPGGVGLEARVYEMDEGPDGALWFATSNGVSRFKNGAWRHWTASEGLPRSLIFSLAVDQDGVAWFASNLSRRLGRIAPDGSVQFFPLPTSLYDAEIWSLRRGPDNRIWLGADGGIAVRQGGDWIGLGVNDGLPNTSVWPVLPEAGSVLIGTGDGVVRLDLSTADAIPAPEVSVTVRAIDRGAVEATWRVGTSRADMAAAHVETRVRLDDDPWSAWSVDRHVSLTGLSGGRHAVAVQARGVLGREGHVATATVAVPGPLWASPWVLGPSLLALLAAAFAARFWLRGRRRETALLRRVADAYSELYREAPDGYLIERLPDRRIEEANASAAQLFGVNDEAALVGASLATLVAPESQEALRQATATLLQSGRAMMVGLRSRRADGSVVELELSSTSVHGDANEPLRSRTTLRDVTARKRAERDLETFRVALDASFEPAVWLARDGGILYANRALGRLVRRSVGALIGHRAYDLWPSAAMLGGDLWARLDAEGTALFEGEFVVDGETTIPVEVAASILPHDGAQHAAVFLRDIRGRRAQEAARRDYEAQLEDVRRQQALGTLGRAVAHEFNNLLSGIMGFGEMLLAELPSSGPARVHAEEITRAATRGADLVGQVLASTGGRHAARSRVAFSPLVERALTEVGGSLPLEVKFETDFGARADVLCSRPDLQRAVANIVRNAIEALPEHGGRVRVETADVELDAAGAAEFGVPSGRYVKLVVRDDGRGMSAEDQRRAFDPFYTTKSPEHRIGLGLSVVRGVVTELRGAMQLRSVLGEGTTCVLLLPVLEETSTRTPTPVEAPPTTARRVLVVDDEAQVLRMTCLLLMRLGYAPTGVGSGREALEALQASPVGFDLMLTDLAMPQMNGLELIRAVRGVRADLDVVVASGFVDDTMRQSLEALAVRAVLPKPYGRKDLVEALASVRVA